MISVVEPIELFPDPPQSFATEFYVVIAIILVALYLRRKMGDRR